MVSKSLSPCINECSEITAGGPRCNRCLRTAEEHLGWNQQSDFKCIEVNERAIREKLEQVWQLFEQGRIKPALVMRKLDELTERGL